jgi:transposase
MVLLKSEKRSSAQVSQILGCCEIVINRWLKRWKAEGLRVGDTRDAVVNLNLAPRIRFT